MNLIEEVENAGLLVLKTVTADEALAVLNDCPDIEAILAGIDMPGSSNGLGLATVVHSSFTEWRSW